MKGRHRISPRAIKRFLQLAAASLAIGLGTGPALADADGGRPAVHAGDDENPEQTRETMSPPYLHRFALPDAAAIGDAQLARPVRLRILDAGGRDLIRLALDGDSMIGPLPHGSYTVLLSRNGLTEVQRIRLGPDTRPFLHFTTSL